MNLAPSVCKVSVCCVNGKDFTDKDGRKRANKTQLVLPEEYKTIVLKDLHDEMGHQDIDHTTSLIRDRFFWLHMQKEIEHYVSRMCTCLKQKTPCKETWAPLTSIVTTQPFELLSSAMVDMSICGQTMDEIESSCQTTPPGELHPRKYDHHSY